MPARRRCGRSCSPRRSAPASTSTARSRSRPTSTRRSRSRASRKASGLKHGAVQDKLFLPGLRKLDMLRRAGFFGRMLAVRIEFGYWVFEGDLQPIQRPSWNYRAEDGGGMILDMMCHWRYVLDNLFGEVKSVSCLGATHIPKRWDEAGKPYAATADDAAYATCELNGHDGEPVIAQLTMSWATRVRRDDLVTFHVDGTDGSAVAGLHRLPGAVARGDAAAGVEPGREADDELLRPVAGGARQPGLRQRLQDPVGSTSSATSSRTRRTSGRSRKAPRACSWSRRRWRAGRSGAGSTCRRWRSEPPLRRLQTRGLAMSLSIALPLADGGTETWTLRDAAPFAAPASTPRFDRIAYSAAHVVADPLAARRPVARLRRSTGTRPSPTGSACGRSASASPRRWTRRSAAWASTGRPRSS